MKVDGPSLLCPSPIMMFYNQIVVHYIVFAFNKNYLNQADTVGITFRVFVP